MRVAHRADHRESITGVRHGQVSDKHVEILCSDNLRASDTLAGGDYFKSHVFKGGRHHFTNGIIVMHKQNLMRSGSFEGSHASYPRG
jgi:hypothetical protein